VGCALTLREWILRAQNPTENVSYSVHTEGFPATSRCSVALFIKLMSSFESASQLYFPKIMPSFPLLSS
jgi:hypothetical protein